MKDSDNIKMLHGTAVGIIMLYISIFINMCVHLLVPTINHKQTHRTSVLAVCLSVLE
jgi:hypothetical protein